ncbi:MAG: hypothetical protein HKM06_03485 [Spirochaetales bacterium]|nr:hypothetical protein [Spirochaetales bacterium]
MDKKQVLGLMNSQIEWLGQSALRLTTKSGKVIYIDPFKLPQNPLHADYIFLTHSHGDHYNPKVVRELKTSKTKIICPLNMSSVATDPMDIGQEKDFGDLWVKAFHAYNQRGFPHAPGKRWLGFLIGFDQFTVYHAGDTDSPLEIADMKPDLALLPISGFMTFGIKDGVEAAKRVGAVVTAPIHYGLIPGTSKNGEKFTAAYPGDSVVLTKV